MARQSPDDLHEAALSYFASHGLTVHETYYDFDHLFYAWRYYGDKRTFTLWISQIAAEDYEPAMILEILREFDPHALMTKFRYAHMHVACHDSGFGAYAHDTFSPTGT